MVAAGCPQPSVSISIEITQLLLPNEDICFSFRSFHLKLIEIGAHSNVDDRAMTAR